MSFLVLALRKFFARASAVLKSAGAVNVKYGRAQTPALRSAFSPSARVLKYGQAPPAQAKAAQTQVAGPVCPIFSQFVRGYAKGGPDDNPFKCLDCDFCCKSAGSLSYHYEKKHPEIYKHKNRCPTCGAYFVTAKQCEDHRPVCPNRGGGGGS